jgi:hypothetical protein
MVDLNKWPNNWPELQARTRVIDGFYYELQITVGQFDDVMNEEGVEIDPKGVYLSVWVVDEENGHTHDRQTFDLTNYCKLVFPVEANLIRMYNERHPESPIE